MHILTHDASLERFVGNGCVKIGRVKIGNNVFIGINSVILPNVNIGDNVIIGAGSIVSKSIPNNSVAVGNPARVISSIDEYVEKHENKMKDPTLVYRGLERTTMSRDEIKEFNSQIDGKIVYIVDK